MDMKPQVLFLSGIRDDATVRVKAVNSVGDLSFSASGSCNVYNFLKTYQVNKLRLTLDARPHFSLPYPEADVMIFNQISEPDTHQITLRKLLTLQNNTPQNIWLNHPQAILETSRDQIATKLKGIPGLIMPHTVRVKLSGLEDLWRAMKWAELNFPVIIRECGTHGGQRMILMANAEDLSSLYPLALDGRAFYLIQYHDYCRENVYTKYRIAVVAGKTYLRGIGSGEGWMVHHKNHVALLKKNTYYREYEKILRAEFYQRLNGLIQPVMGRIIQALRLDFFGIDCHISKQGEILIFEANASMSILEEEPDLELRAYWRGQNEAIKEALVEMILDKYSSRPNPALQP